MNKILALLAIAVCWASTAGAQTTAKPDSKLLWEANGVATPVDAQAQIYRYYLDTANGVVLTSVTCAAGPTGSTQQATCTVGIPAMTVGDHQIALTMSGNDPASESSRSNVLALRMVVVKATPTNLRIAAVLQQAFGVRVVHLSSRRSAFHWTRHALLGVVQP
jgi:hypothetical protein